MKKIGIITLYGRGNIGNKLQNYAVVKILKEYGFDSSTIIYYPVDSQGGLKAYAKLYAKKLVEKTGICTTDFYIKRIEKSKRMLLFRDFDKKYIPTTSKYLFKTKQMNRYAKDFDYYCAGSDQIWSPAYVQNHGFCFMRFAESKKAFSFSASMGTTYVPPKYYESIKAGFQHVGNISVREEDVKALITKMTGRESVVLSDPTMLLDNEDWKKIAEAPSFDVPSKYVATYFLGNITPQQKEFIQNYAKDNSLEIVELNGPLADRIGPSEFLYLIENSSFVFTDSFHGTAFSIIFKKKFMVFQRNNIFDMSSRITTVLKTYKLEEFFVKTDNNNLGNEIKDTLSFIEGKDMSHLDDIRKSERQKADDFLNKVFETEV